MLLFVAGVKASQLLCGVGPLAEQTLRAGGPNEVCSMASGGGVPTNDEQVIGLEREVMMVAWKGLDPYNMLAPKQFQAPRRTLN